jgi:hypothetical protein
VFKEGSVFCVIDQTDLPGIECGVGGKARKCNEAETIGGCGRSERFAGKVT